MNVNKIEYLLNFSNVEYVIYVTTNEDSLEITIENSLETKYWTGSFEAKYIEELSMKAKCYKAFPVFIKMLLNALSKDSDSLKIELLGGESIEQMKANKNDSLNSSNISSSNSDKSRLTRKYLVIEYHTEFEQVKYPLLLNLLNNPSHDLVKRTISRLRKRHDSSDTDKINNNHNYINYKEYDEVKKENMQLKSKVKYLEENRKFGAVDNDEIIRNYGDIHDKFESYKIESERGLLLLTKNIEELKSRINEGDSRSINNFVNNNETNNYTKKIKELEDQIDKLNNLILQEKNQFSKIVDNNDTNEEKLFQEITLLRE